MTKKFWLLSVFFLLVCGVGATGFHFKDTVISTVQKLPYFKEDLTHKLTEPDKQEHIVVLTENGFEPNELVIRQHDQILFKTTRGVPFWPASNNHPEHTIYTEFDSKGRVTGDKQWLFKFERLGTFKYHDHLSANDIGTVTVLSEDAELTIFKANDDIEECKKYSDTYQKQQCWDTQLDFVLKDKGVDAAFDYFIKLYNTDPGVPKECHGWGHTLGRAAYQEYQKGAHVPLRPESVYCGFGYFHGFMSDLLKYTGDATKTKDFCEEAALQLAGVKSIRNSCVHGFGHGAAAMLLEQPENWGNFQKTINEGVGLCEKTYTTKEDLINCYDGVFNETHLDLFNSLYGLDFKKYMEQGDPLLYCKQQEERHKESCYFEFVGMFGQLFNFDVVKSMQYALDNVENLSEYGQKIIYKISGDRIQISIVNETHEDSVEACQLVPKFLSEDCFSGILNGFIQHGNPNTLHKNGYAFCGEPSLSEDERTFCYSKFTRMLVQIYNKDELVNACSSIRNVRKVKECEDIDALIAHTEYR